MPNQKEIAVITVNGQNYKHWETVWVHLEFPGIYRHFRFSVSEQNPMGKNVKDIQIKTGDDCTITLGGEQVLKGYVYERQMYMDANNHAVQITGQSIVGDATLTSI